MDTDFLIEKWKKIEFEEDIYERENYQISNKGNVKSFKQYPEHGMLIRLFAVNGYLRLPIRKKNGKRTARYIHKLVAEYFVPKTTDDQTYVLHLDYNKDNNNAWNLEWANKKEKEMHQFSNPKYKDEYRIRNSKLTEGRVRMIKKKLLDPNRKTRLKIIARQFGISEMQLHRIKTGENWGHVVVD